MEMINIDKIKTNLTKKEKIKMTEEKAALVITRYVKFHLIKKHFGNDKKKLVAF